MTINRRTFLRTGIALTAATAVDRPAWPLCARAAGQDAAGWRTFEVVMDAEVLDPSGPSRVWLPMPLTPDTEYHRSLGHTWTGNPAHTHVYKEAKYGTGIFYAAWPSGERAPIVNVTYRFVTHDRAVDLAAPDDGRRRPEDKRTLAKYLEATRLIRTDGIVATTSEHIPSGRRGEVEKARAIYDWIVDNTFRDPKVRGCGIGDIRAMLETGNLGGKCADLNALFVGLARAAGASEMNYLAFNYAHDITLPNAAGGPLSFLMYPQAETGSGRKDCLDPETFRYKITSRVVG